MDKKKLIEGLETILAALKEDAENTEEEKQEDAPKKEEPKVTLEEVRAILAQKSSCGKGLEVRALLKKHGADKLSSLKEEEYASVLKEAQEL